MLEHNQSPFLSSPDSPTDLSQASDVSSTASDESRQATLLLNLDVVNSALQLLNVMPIPAHNSKNTVYTNQKIEELGDSIREKLGIPKPEQSIGEKILSQFVDKFGQLSTTDQYKVLTSMPENESRENIQNLFGVSERKARRGK